MSTAEKQNALRNTFRFSEADQQRFYQKLWDLLTRQAARYNGAESTSMPIEDAQALLRSLAFTLSFAAAADGISAEALLQKDFQEVIARGQTLLQQMRKEAQAAWKALCLTAPDIRNEDYIATIQNLGIFFQRYELYYRAHDLPCSITYPLLNPVPAGEQGVVFVAEYIRRLTVENRLLNSFSADAVLNVLRRSCVNYREFYMNLCEPVLTRAVGRVLLGKDLASLCVTREDVAALTAALREKTKEDTIEALLQALETVLKIQGMEEADSAYFLEHVKGLAMRVDAAAKTGHLANVFFPD